VAIIVILVAAPSAQQPATPSPQPAAAAFLAAPTTSGAAPALATPTDVDLLVGRSTILNVGSPIARVSLTVPDIADAMVTSPGQLLIHGKQPGTISLFVWDRAGAITTYEVKVRRDLTALIAQLKQLFPGEQIAVAGSGKDVVLSGTVSGQYVIDKAASVAGGYVEKKENVVNLLRQQEGVASNQVMLRVRFAEVSRSAITELGANLFTGPGGFHDYVARSTTQQFAAPMIEGTRSSIQGPPDRWGGGRDIVDATGGKNTFSDLLNIFLFNNKYNVGTVIKALQEKGLFQSLAEPNLIATNGKEASFLAGGEFPYPVVQGGNNGNSVTIMFKEFGIRLNFTPTVLGGDLINLKVRPEVSSLDFGNAVTVEGFRVPALTTRRTDTEVELRDGQTFAIAGLMSNSVQDSMRKIPGIGDIPILGWMFKSKAMQKQQTELVVMITPVIIKRGQMGASEALPSLIEPYMATPNKTLPNPDPYVGSPRYPANQPAPKPRTDAPEPAPQAGAAAQPQGAMNPLEMARPVANPTVAPAPQPAPIASRPIPEAPPVPPMVQPQAAAPTKQEVKALEQAREEERKAAAAAEKDRIELEKRDAEQKKVAAKADEKRRAEQARLDAEQAKRDEVARIQAEKIAKERERREAEEAKAREKRENDAARKKVEEDQRRDKALSDAAARLKQAQAQYQSELEKAGKDAAGKDAPRQ
jgi:pilus assembly protein CpaC